MPPPEPLDYPHLHALRSAEGWIELGNPTEAWEELQLLLPQWKHHPDVLAVLWHILSHQKKWEQALEISQKLKLISPQTPIGYIHHAYTLHELKQTLEAWNELIPAFEKFPENSIIPYNLACYACQLGHLDAAQHWFQKAMTLGDKKVILQMALTDKDLQPLWPTLTPSAYEL